MSIKVRCTREQNAEILITKEEAKPQPKIDKKEGKISINNF